MVRLVSALVSFGVLFLLFSIKSNRDISADALRVTSQLQEGDVILIHSEDFFSKFVRSVDDCKQSSFKLVVRDENQIKLLVSDANDISDNTQGLRLEEPIDYFSSYGTLEIKHLRPFALDESAILQIRKYIERSKSEVVSYDFSYYKNAQEKLTCEKVINTVYKDSFSDVNSQRKWFWAFLPCDFDESKFQALSPWTQFFAKR